MSIVKGFKVFNPEWTYHDWLRSDARDLPNFDEAIFEEVSGIKIN